MARYEVEVWDKSGKVLGDIYQACSNLTWSKTLNGSEALNFDIDLNRFEQLLDKNGYATDPFAFLEVGRTDIRLKRNGVYILGANVNTISYTDSDPSVKMTVQCVGYLNFYKTQYITAKYSQWYQEDILNDVITKCNAKTGGDYGITRGTSPSTHVKRDRTYERKEVASLIQQMSEVINGCDFAFTPDKKFNTYDAKGVYRPSVVLTYGSGGNIQSFTVNRSIANVANYIYGIGSGNGSDAVQSSAEDTTSEGFLYRREKIATWNSVSRQDTLDEHTAAVLHYTKDIIELPTVTVRDGALDLSVVDTGDSVKVKISSNIELQHIDGYYRIEAIDCSVDDNGSETTSLQFDDIDIESIISKQEEEDV